MSFEDSKPYLNKRIKYEGKTEKFGEDVPIGRDKIKIKMENDVNPPNPWKVKSLQEFRVFKCPECEKKFDTNEQLVGHAMMSHPKARDALPEVLSDQGVEDVHDVEDGEDVEDFHEVHDVKAEDSGYEDTKKVLTPELLVFQHLKNFKYSYVLVDQFCQEVKFSPPEEEKNVVSIQEVLQYYKSHENAIIRCEFCDEKFTSKIKLKHHVEIVHSKENDVGQNSKKRKQEKDGKDPYDDKSMKKVKFNL